jgi:hypothetical protein
MNTYQSQSMTTRVMKRTAPVALALALATVFSASARAQQLPDAKSLFAKYSAAMNGEALAKVQSVRETGTFALAAFGLSGPVEIVRAQPNKSLVRINIPGIGEIVQGFDGTVGFSMNPMQGNSLLKGQELAAEKEDGYFTASLGAPEFFTSMETIEKTTMGGVDCYKVKLVWKSGRTTYDCFAVDTGLRAGNISMQESPAGATEVTVLLSDYKKFGDITFPTKITQLVAGNEQVITITGVEFNQVAESAFALPAPIKALVPPQR